MHEEQAAAFIAAAYPNLTDAERAERLEDEILGAVLDNPAANRLALKDLEARHPKWLGLGCQDHGLNLAVKDFNNPDKCPKLAPILQNVST
jgi:hypothetical protein